MEDLHDFQSAVQNESFIFPSESRGSGPVLCSQRCVGAVGVLNMESRGDWRAAVGPLWAGEVCSDHIDGLSILGPLVV